MGSSSWPEGLPSNRNKAIQELTQGKQLTDRLREILRQPHNIEADLTSVDIVMMQVMEMFDNTLSILSSCSFNEASHIPISYMQSLSSWDGRKSKDFNNSVRTATSLKTKRGCYKRKEHLWTSTKITSYLIDDGHAWRKYGQKAILNAKYQRNYYRCTHKNDHGCQATKQVQKIDNKPPKYKITYNGHHTCKNSQNPRDTTVLLSFEMNGMIDEMKQINSCSPTTKHEPKEGISPINLIHNQSSLSDQHLSRNFSMHVSPDAMSIRSSGLDHEPMISSGAYSSTANTHDYEIKHILGSNKFDDFPFELCS